MTPRSSRCGRGQANLVALAVALVALVSAATLGLVVADGALAAADRDALDRRAAVAAADRLTTASSVVVRRNVLDGAALEGLTPARLDELAPPLAERAFRVRLGGEVVAARGDPEGGVTVRRIVLVATETTERRTVAVDDGTVTLPRRTDQLTLDFAAASGVETVRVDGRVVLHDPAGLTGTYLVDVPRHETIRVSFDGGAGEVGLTYYPERTRKAVLAVTVDD